MPIHRDFLHPDRLVVAVVRGSVSAEDIANAVRELIATLVRAVPGAASRGRIAEAFTRLMQGERPVKMFCSIHAACRDVLISGQVSAFDVQLVWSGLFSRHLCAEVALH